MIERVTYERLFSLGNYENLKLAATAVVEIDGDVQAAFIEAKNAVLEQYELFQAERAEAADRARAEREAARRRYEEQLALQQADNDEDDRDLDDTGEYDDDADEDDDADDDGFHL